MTVFYFGFKICRKKSSSEWISSAIQQTAKSGTLVYKPTKLLIAI